MPETPAIRKRFHSLLDTLRTIDEQYFSEARRITEPDEIAEGYRLLMHVLQSSVDFFLESDPARPEFKRIISKSRKHTGDNPDVVYYHALVSGESDFVICGKLCGEAYLSFTVYRSQNGVWTEGVSSELNHTQLVSDADGNYEIHLSPTSKPGNWLKTHKDTFQVVARHYFEHATPAGASEIDPRPRLSRVEPVESRPRKRAEDIDAALEKMDRYLRAMTIERMNVGGDGMPEWFSNVPNTMGKPRIWDASDGGGNGTPDVAYGAGFYWLQPGQALLIRGRMPRCVYASAVLANRYLQSLEYRDRQICLNRESMEIAEDGQFQVVVAPEDPGLPNWLDTEGRLGGVVYWRFMLPEEDIAPLVCEVVSLVALAAPVQGGEE